MVVIRFPRPQTTFFSYSSWKDDETKNADWEYFFFLGINRLCALVVNNGVVVTFPNGLGGLLAPFGVVANEKEEVVMSFC